MRIKLSAFSLLYLIFLASAFGNSVTVEGIDKDLRLNEIQYIGTHNSYHIAMGDALAILLKASDYEESELWTAENLIYATDYTHPVLSAQLDLGIRQFEFDLYADPEGGRFSNPILLHFLGNTPWELSIGIENMKELETPGFKVLHNPEYDFRSNRYLLRSNLEEIFTWSQRNPNHLPIIIHLECKEDTPEPISDEHKSPSVLRFSEELWLSLEEEILSVIPREKIFMPEDLMADHGSLRKSVLKSGWPTISELEGKFIFLLLNKRETSNRYLEFAGNLEGRIIFPNAPVGDTRASWFRVPAPKLTVIQPLIEKGFLVTTMADQHTVQSRHNDYSRMEKAFQSGAQFILTDFPIPDRRFSNYQVRFENDRWVREKDK